MHLQRAVISKHDIIIFQSIYKIFFLDMYAVAHKL
jgi:hypothetical protein